MEQKLTVQMLALYESSDDLQIALLEETMKLIEQIKPVGHEGNYMVYLVNFDEAPVNILESIYYTDMAKAVIAESAIIINASFLAELEAAVRAFNVSDRSLFLPYFESDDLLFNLIREYLEDPNTVLNKLREADRLNPFQNEDIPPSFQQITLLVFFIICHEIGHLQQAHSTYNFGHLHPYAASEKIEVDKAVVKMCSHVDDFKRLGFHLPGFDETANQTSKVRLKPSRYRIEHQREFDNYSIWLQDENQADQVAINYVTQYFQKACDQSEYEGSRVMYAFVKSMFAAGIYFWHRDLMLFSRKMAIPWPPDHRRLYMTLVGDRKNYVHASVLFGYTHRFLLLRCVLATTELFLSADSRYAGQSNWTSPVRWGVPSSADQWLAWRQAECIEMHLLLRVLMDTPVKLAYVGCSESYMSDIDRLRQRPLVFSMSFDSIQRAVKRVINRELSLQQTNKPV